MRPTPTSFICSMMKRRVNVAVCTSSHPDCVDLCLTSAPFPSPKIILTAHDLLLTISAIHSKYVNVNYSYVQLHILLQSDRFFQYLIYRIMTLLLQKKNPARVNLPWLNKTDHIYLKNHFEQETYSL